MFRSRVDLQYYTQQLRLVFFLRTDDSPGQRKPAFWNNFSNPGQNNICEKEFSSMPLAFPSHQGLIAPLWRLRPDWFDIPGLFIGAAMPDVIDGVIGAFRGHLGQGLGHSLIALPLLCVPGVWYSGGSPVPYPIPGNPGNAPDFSPVPGIPAWLL